MFVPEKVHVYVVRMFSNKNLCSAYTVIKLPLVPTPYSTTLINYWFPIISHSKVVKQQNKVIHDPNPHRKPKTRSQNGKLYT